MSETAWAVVLFIGLYGLVRALTRFFNWRKRRIADVIKRGYLP